MQITLRCSVTASYSKHNSDKADGTSRVSSGHAPGCEVIPDYLGHRHLLVALTDDVRCLERTRRRHTRCRRMGQAPVPGRSLPGPCTTSASSHPRRSAAPNIRKVLGPPPIPSHPPLFEAVPLVLVPLAQRKLHVMQTERDHRHAQYRRGPSPAN